MPLHAPTSRRTFLLNSALVAGAGLVSSRWALAADEVDPRVAAIVAKTIGIDTHNHIDLPMTAEELPGPNIDLKGEMKKSGLSAICATFATDYQQGDAYARFLTAMKAMDAQLERNGMKRALTAADVRAAHTKAQPIVIQSVEGGHFLQGKVERVAEAYGRGLRHMGLLHDSDATVALGDVYTNTPKFGGLTAFGKAVIQECNRLGMLVDLAHADMQTTEAALKVSTKPVVVSHTGLDTQLGGDARMAQMMRPRLISKEQAKAVASTDGAVGVWIHLSDTPVEFAKNVRALVDVIGAEHVCIGTDTKLMEPTPRRMGPPPPGFGGDKGPQLPNGNRPGQQRPRAGERTNEAWTGETAGFYYTVVDAMLKTGFTSDEIAKIAGGNYLRIFEASTR